MCVIMSQCPLLTTLIQSVSHLVVDSLTILLPQFSTLSVKSLLALLYTGKCPLRQDCGMEVEEIKQIIQAVGFNIGTEDLEIMEVEEVLSEISNTVSINNASDTNGKIKIEVEIKIEPKQEPEENDEQVGSSVFSPTSREDSEFDVVVGATVVETGETEGKARVEVCDDISTTEHEEGEAGCQIHSEVQGVAYQSQPGAGVVDQIDEGCLKVDIDEDSWQEEFDHKGTSEELDINSSLGALGEEETGGRIEKR